MSVKFLLLPLLVHFLLVLQLKLNENKKCGLKKLKLNVSFIFYSISGHC